MTGQMLLLQHGRVAFPLLFQLLGKVVVFQNRTRCLLVFLAVGEGNGVEKSDAALLVSIGVGQKSDGQSAATGIPLMRAASRTQSAVSGRMDGKTTLVRSAAKAASGNNHRAAKRKITVLIEVFP